MAKNILITEKDGDSLFRNIEDGDLIAIRLRDKYAEAIVDILYNVTMMQG